MPEPLTTGTTGKTLEVVGKQGSYKTELTSSVEEIRQCTERIKAEGQTCQSEESHEVFLSSGRTEEVLNRLLSLMETHCILQMRRADSRKFWNQSCYSIARNLSFFHGCLPFDANLIICDRQCIS